MKKHSLAAIVATAVVIGGAAAAVNAATEAPWQAAAIKSPNAVGSISLVDAAGQPVDSGSIEEPFAAFAVGNGGLASGAADKTVAALSLYTPTSVVAAPTAAAYTTAAALTVGPDSWTGVQIATPTTQNATFPAGVTGPTVNLAGSTTLKQYLAGYENTLTDSAYAGVYELRLTTAVVGQAFTSTYNVLDIQVGNDGKWHAYGEGTPVVGPSAACKKATADAATTAGALATANSTLAKAKAALTKASTASVKSYLKATAKLAKAKTKKAKTAAKKAVAKAKKKAGTSAIRKYNAALAAQKAAAANQAAKAKASAAAAKAKTAACA